MGAILPNLRLILIGKGMGPSLFEIAALWGKITIKRFKERLHFSKYSKKTNESIKVYGIRTYFHAALKKKRKLEETILLILMYSVILRRLLK